MLYPRLILIDGTKEDQKLLGSGERVYMASLGTKHSSDIPTRGQIKYTLDSKQPIKDLIEAAQRSDWLAELERHKRLVPPNLEFDDLCRIQVADFVSYAFDQASTENWDRLQKVASEVLDRPTTFSFTESIGDIDFEQRKGFFGAMANELKNDPRLLDKSRICFIRLKPNKEFGAHDAFMASLVTALTAGKRHAGVEREGPILLIGKTGAGKTELARALHLQVMAKLGRSGPFIPINVAAISPDLLESRLRGYAPGTFTGAAKGGKPSLFELANDGTLFLDEFQAAPAAIQLQLLDLMRAVSDTVQIARIGEDSRIKTFRVKLILATNESVKKLMEEKKLRQDLFYRIRHEIIVPSLHERLVNEPHLLQRLWCLHRWRSNPPLITADADGSGYDALTNRWPHPMTPALDHVELLRKQEWPGNMREFERVCFDVYGDYDSWAAVETFDWLDAFNLALRIDSLIEPVPTIDQATYLRLKQAEQILIDHDFVVRRAQGNLAGLKLKSPKALKNFLRANRKYLTSSCWQEDSRAKSLVDDRPQRSK